jgi:hypothetical protein
VVTIEIESETFESFAVFANHLKTEEVNTAPETSNRVSKNTAQAVTIVPYLCNEFIIVRKVRESSCVDWNLNILIVLDRLSD